MTLDDSHRPLREFWDSNAAWFNASPGRRTPALVDSLVEGLEHRRGRCGDLLDLACGAGRTTRALRDKLAPTGRTVGVDLSSVMIRAARQEALVEDPRGPAAGSNTGRLAFYEAAAEQLPFEPDSFDLAFCNLGLMLFPDPGAALKEVARVLTAGSEFRACVWGREEHTTLVTLMPRVAQNLTIPLAMPPRSNFHLGSTEALEAAAEGSFMRLQQARPVVLTFPFDDGRSACEEMGISVDSPSPRLTTLGDDHRRRLVEGCVAEADRLLADSGGALVMDLLVAEFVGSE